MPRSMTTMGLGSRVGFLAMTSVEESCAESSTEEFPFLGILWTPGVDPDPPPLSTILSIAPRRSVDPVR